MTYVYDQDKSPTEEQMAEHLAQLWDAPVLPPVVHPEGWTDEYGFEDTSAWGVRVVLLDGVRHVIVSTLGRAGRDTDTVTSELALHGVRHQGVRKAGFNPARVRAYRWHSADDFVGWLDGA